MCSGPVERERTPAARLTVGSCDSLSRGVAAVTFKQPLGSSAAYGKGCKKKQATSAPVRSVSLSSFKAA